MEYKEVIKGIINIIENTEQSDIGFANICTYIGKNCPELQESEDERIRKDILEFIKHEGQHIDKYKWHKWIAWLEKQGDKDKFIEKELGCIKGYRENAIKRLEELEKQGESYTKKDVDDAYLKGISDAKNEIEKQYEANYQIRKDIATFIFNYKGDIKDRAKWMNYLGIKVSFVEKQNEHNPAWSEEDERMFHVIIADFKGFKHENTSTLELHFDECISWLKSLKQRLNK